MFSYKFWFPVLGYAIRKFSSTVVFPVQGYAIRKFASNVVFSCTRLCDKKVCSVYAILEAVMLILFLFISWKVLKTRP